MVPTVVKFDNESIADSSVVSVVASMASILLSVIVPAESDKIAVPATLYALLASISILPTVKSAFKSHLYSVVFVI